MRTREFINQTLNCGTIFDHTHCASVLLAAALAHLPAAAATLTPPETASPKTIPWAEVGAAAGAQYSGDGLSVTPTPDGARLRCVFQRMEGQVTCEGLWVSSTVANQANDRFRITATAFGRAGSPLPADGAPGVTRSIRLPATGIVSVDDNTVRFTRPGLVEEYSVNMDGVRQDFVVLEKPSLPLNQAELCVELSVFGARVEPMAGGARLVLENSGRKIAYSRLKVTDAKGKELPARIEVASDSALRISHSALAMAILVDDADAVYPVRIDPTFSDANWISMGGIPGTDGELYAAVSDASGNLYIGGQFTVVGDVAALRIAKWNGSHWSALGSGIEGDVYALAVSGSDVYAGGRFTLASGVWATNIAKWDGTSWSALGSGINDVVWELAVSGNDLYAGGAFTRAGAVTANNVAKWNGSNWSALGSGVGSSVFALAVSANGLYAGGWFGIAEWNGTSWSAPGGGIGGDVRALAVSGNDLYAGGNFTTAGGVAATNIAKWNGNNWSALGSGITASTGIPYYDGVVFALVVSGNDLYAGGQFTTAGGVAAINIAKWNGSTWSALGSGMNEKVYALAVTDGDLYAAGYFTTAGDSAARTIAKWNGNRWNALGSGMNGYVFALAVSGSDLYAAGYFTTADGSATNHIAKWNGSTWGALGSGVNGNVYTLALSGGDLYAGGDFTSAGGVLASCIAKWNGNSWSALSSAINGSVSALAVSGSDVYAGGQFTIAGGVAATNIAKWNGSSWSALGLGVSAPPINEGYYYLPHYFNTVSALAVLGEDLYVGGWFTNAGGVLANRIAKWNGNNWSPLGSGIGGGYSHVHALAVSGSDVYAGGDFTTAGDVAAANIAKWNGSSWSALGSGLGFGSAPPYRLSPTVCVLAVSGNDLFAGGRLGTAGGMSANLIAKWNGSGWNSLGSGMTDGNFEGVYALAVMGSDLYAGGSFTRAGGKVSAYLAKAIINPPVLALERNTSGTNFIRFSGVPGTAYHLQRAPSLVGPWPNIATNIAPAQGRIEVGDSSPPQNQAFYRVVEP